jgi:soluble lytic murein transglycosylase-like protein
MDLYPASAQRVLFAGLIVASCAAAAADPGFVRQRPGTPPPEIRALVPEWQTAMSVPDRTALARRPFHMEIVKAAERAGIDPALVHAVIRVESAYNARAVSPKGAMGLKQVMPGTGRRFGVDDLLQPGASISAGTQYLSHLMRLFQGDLSLALAAYNAGEGAVIRYGRKVPPYRETRGYVPRVLSTYQALAALPAVPAPAPKPVGVVEAAIAQQ